MLAADYTEMEFTYSSDVFELITVQTTQSLTAVQWCIKVVLLQQLLRNTWDTPIQCIIHWIATLLSVPSIYQMLMITKDK